MSRKQTPAVRDRAQGTPQHQLSMQRAVIRLCSPAATVAPLNREQLKNLFLRLRGYSGSRTTYLAVRLALYTFVHISDMRRSKWEDARLDEALWDIRADRSKSKRRHLVPLSNQAISALRELYEITEDGENMFPNARLPRGVMSETSIGQAMRHLVIPLGGSVFRATASKHLLEMGGANRLLELQLGHADRNNLKGFDRGEDIHERREMMQQWADWLDAIEAEMVEGE